MLKPLLSPPDLALFKDSYDHARHQFLELVRQLDSARANETHTLPVKGPRGGPLHTDCVWIGPEAAGKVLVLISGTHGVEGFAGSAIQTDLLHQLSDGSALPDDTAILMIHALNAWGMAWLRRCDHEGIDLNRNFIDFTHPVPRNPGYHELRGYLMQEDRTLREEHMQRYAQAHGQSALEIAVSGGQYEDPHGPFFGGRRASFARRLIEGLMQRHRLAERRLAVIDLHTGLGPYGYGEIICDHAPDSGGTRTAHAWYGDAVTLPLAGTSSSVPKTGLLDYAWHGIMNDDSCFVTLEFGSHSVSELFDTILADHRLHALGPVNMDAPEVSTIKQRLFRHFYPATTQWQELVLLRARQVIRLALEGLTQ